MPLVRYQFNEFAIPAEAAILIRNRGNRFQIPACAGMTRNPGIPGSRYNFF